MYQLRSTDCPVFSFIIISCSDLILIFKWQITWLKNMAVLNNSLMCLSRFRRRFDHLELESCHKDDHRVPREAHNHSQYVQDEAESHRDFFHVQRWQSLVSLSWIKDVQGCKHAVAAKQEVYSGKIIRKLNRNKVIIRLLFTLNFHNKWETLLFKLSTYL